MDRFKQFMRSLPAACCVPSNGAAGSSSSVERRKERQREVVQEPGSPRIQDNSAATSVSPSPSPRVKNNCAATSVTMELDVLDCLICWDPLQPPTFQCAVGHVICSSCLGKLPQKKKCPYCSSKGDFSRCYGIEKVLESIQVPCSNAKYGCAVKSRYYQKRDHEATCPNAPCLCPGTGSGFMGSTGMLFGHFTTEHHWPSAKFKYGMFFDIDVQEGLHALSGDDEQLFLINIESEPSGCVVSVFYVWPHDTEPKFRCRVLFSSWKNDWNHTQSSEFQVPSTALSDGIPRDCTMFIVPKFYLEEESKIRVTMYMPVRNLTPPVFSESVVDQITSDVIN